MKMRRGTRLDRAQPSHFYLLDLLRGLAALAVVIWHYQHFFFEPPPATLPGNFVRSLQPFYGVLSLFYTEGSRAVQLFFVLSGFIFFSQYLEEVRLKRVGAARFFVLRVSRLYPLYLLTLLIVAAGQWISFALDGNYIVYPCNSFRRFVLALTFVSEWLPQKYVCSVAFNGPAWSLSVEAFLYVIFFLFARYLASRRSALTLGMTLGLVVVGVLVYAYDLYHLMGEPLFCFFSGGVAFLIWDRVETQNRLLVVVLSALLATAALAYSALFSMNAVILGAVLYPSVVLFLATVQTDEQGKQFRFIGDITYSVYLLHFPVQLCILLTLKVFGVYLNFLSPFFWITYFGALVSAAAISFERFERPMQRRLRRMMMGDSGHERRYLQERRPERGVESI